MGQKVIQQNKQTYNNLLISGKKLHMKSVLGVLDIKLYLKNRKRIRNVFKVNSIIRLAGKIFRDFLTFMVEDMIENDTTYYFDKNKRTKFYICKAPKSYVKDWFKYCFSDSSKIETPYIVVFSYRYGDITINYMLKLPTPLKIKLEQAIINGKTYRGGFIE